MEFDFNLSKARITVSTFIGSSLLILGLLIFLEERLGEIYVDFPVLALAMFVVYFACIAILVFRLIHFKNIKIQIKDNILTIPTYYLGKKEIELSKVFSVESKIIKNEELMIIGVEGSSGYFLDSNRFENIRDFFVFKEEIKKLVIKSSSYPLFENENKFLVVHSNKAYVTWIFAFVCILIFGLNHISNFFGLSFEEFLYLGVAKKNIIEIDDWYRIFSSSFIHANIFHLLLNLFIFGMLGELLEKVVARARLLIVILASACVGYIFFIHFSVHEYGAGFSGAAFGLFGAYMALRVRYEGCLPGSLRMVPLQQIFLLIVAEFLLEFFVLENVDYSVHLGGFIAGFLYLFISTKEKKLDDIGKTGVIEKYLAGFLGFAYLAGLAFFVFLVFKGEVANMPDCS